MKNFVVINGNWPMEVHAQGRRDIARKGDDGG